MIKNFEALSEKDVQKVFGGKADEDCFVYVLKQGDSLATLAQRYGTTVKKICEINNILDPKDIVIGEKIRIPM